MTSIRTYLRNLCWMGCDRMMKNVAKSKMLPLSRIAVTKLLVSSNSVQKYIFISSLKRPSLQTPIKSTIPGEDSDGGDEKCVNLYRQIQFL